MYRSLTCTCLLLSVRAGLCGPGQIQCRNEKCRKWTVRGSSRHYLCRQCDTERRKSSKSEPHPTNEPPRPLMHTRKRKAYDELGPAQRSVRRKLGRTALAEIGVLASALCVKEQHLSPLELLTLSTATRRRIRSVKELRKHIPGEKKMAECKKTLALTHGTEIATFTFRSSKAKESDEDVIGAYVTDPLRLLRIVSAGSAFLSVGGDKGGEFTKLAEGVTDTVKQIQHFLPLLVFEGSDHYDDLQALRTLEITTFCGESQEQNIFSVLQYIIDHYKAFLNGDWPFISCILAHKGHAATYPCPICIVDKKSLLSSAIYRRPADGNSLHHVHDAFLVIPPERIVPTPLHLFLGISNRIIFNAYKELVGEQALTQIISAVKSKHSAGCGGLSDLYSLMDLKLPVGSSRSAVRTSQLLPRRGQMLLSSVRTRLSNWDIG